MFERIQTEKRKESTAKQTDKQTGKCLKEYRQKKEKKTEPVPSLKAKEMNE